MLSTRVRLAVASLVVMCAAIGMAGAARAVGQAPAPPATQAPASPPVSPPPAESGTAPTPADQAGQPIFRAGINFVRVDVIVTDRQGNPITDLTQDDFEIVEDDTRQTVETFRLVKIDTTAPVETLGRLSSRADEETAAQNDDARIFVFFLDEYHVRLGNSMAARKHLVEFVQTQLGPKDLVSVMYPLSPIDSVVLTRDHRQLVNAIERFQGRKFDYTPRNALEDRYANYPTEVVERVRRQVSLSALEGLSVKLGALREGRKAIVLVSEGYLAMLPPQLRGAVATMPGLGNPNRNNPLAGENDLMEDRARFSAELDVQTELQRVFDAANRSNTTIYAVDPRGLSTGEFDIQDNVTARPSQDALRQTQSTLQILAEETDGRAIINRMLDYPAVPEQLVGLELSTDARERSLGGEGDQDLAVPLGRHLRRRLLIGGGEGVAPPAVEVQVGAPDQLRARVLREDVLGIERAAPARQQVGRHRAEPRTTGGTAVGGMASAALGADAVLELCEPGEQAVAFFGGLRPVEPSVELVGVLVEVVQLDGSRVPGDQRPVVGGPQRGVEAPPSGVATGTGLEHEVASGAGIGVERQRLERPPVLHESR